MAKVTGPLFSLGARGQIAKTLVFMSWKGIADVRKYVIPANPRTTLQVAQRAKFTSCIDAWHTNGYTEADINAWNLLAGTMKIAASGFNVFVKKMITALLTPLTFKAISDVTIAAPSTTGAVVTSEGLDDQDAILYVGDSKTQMLTNFAGVLVATTNTYTITGLVLNTNYWFYIANSKAGDSGRTGIYGFRTAAA